MRWMQPSASSRRIMTGGARPAESPSVKSHGPATPRRSPSTVERRLTARGAGVCLGRMGELLEHPLDLRDDVLFLVAEVVQERVERLADDAKLLVGQLDAVHAHTLERVPIRMKP